jgi:hypothetical protein
MRYLLGRTSLNVLLLAALLVTIRVSQVGSVSVHASLYRLAPDSCAMPCWRGIRPGLSTMMEAVRSLLANPDIDPASLHPLCQICISLAARWKPAQNVAAPQAADPSAWTVLIESRRNTDVVHSIVLQVSVPVGDFVSYFGVPSRTTAGILPDRNLYLDLEYPTLGMFYSVNAPCRLSQNMLKLSGGFYILQEAQDYTPPYGLRIRDDRHGFGSADLDRLARDAGCG